MYKAYRVAPPRQAPQDFASPTPPPPKSPAAAELDRLVDEFVARHNRTNAKKLSRAQAYDRVFNDEDNRELRDRVRREEMEATRRVGNRLDRVAKRRR